jgi:hypothetical protein
VFIVVKEKWNVSKDSLTAQRYLLRVFLKDQSFAVTLIKAATWSRARISNVAQAFFACNAMIMHILYARQQIIVMI